MAANLAATASTWMEMVDNANVAGTTPTPSSPQPSNLASATKLWIEKQGTNTPTMKSIPNLAAAAHTWMEMLDNADVAGTTPAPSFSQLPNLASTTALWMEMQGTNTPSLTPISTHQSTHPSLLAGIAQIWLDMDSTTDAAVKFSFPQPHNLLAATTQLWLDMKIPANPSPHPKDMEVDANVGANLPSTGDNQHPVDTSNLTVSLSKIILTHQFTEGNFLCVPVEWFSNQEPSDADEMSK